MSGGQARRGVGDAGPAGRGDPWGARDPRNKEPHTCPADPPPQPGADESLPPALIGCPGRATAPSDPPIGWQEEALSRELLIGRLIPVASGAGPLGGRSRGGQGSCWGPRGNAHRPRPLSAVESPKPLDARGGRPLVGECGPPL